MDKKELLQEVSNKLRTGEITREEILSLIGITKTTQESSVENRKVEKHFSISKLLYILGAAIVIIGIVIFIAQIWDNIGPISHILLTLGLGIMATGIGSALLKKKPEYEIGPVFHFIGGVLIPGGSMVTLSELGYNFNPDFLWPVTIVLGAIFAFYLLLNSVHKHPVLTFFAIANGTAFTYALFESIFGGLYLDDSVYAYLTMAVGGSYLFLAHSFKDSWNHRLIGLLHFFGSAGILGSAFSQMVDSVLWQMLYIFIILGAFWLSVYMRTTGILVVGTFSLIAYVSFITSEYFANSIGWPISLVILGFIFIGLGYASITINNKYIKKDQND